MMLEAELSEGRIQVHELKQVVWLLLFGYEADLTICFLKLSQSELKALVRRGCRVSCTSGMQLRLAPSVMSIPLAPAEVIG